MATVKRKSNKQPTAKQLKARRAFARMAKARAKAARKKNPTPAQRAAWKRNGERLKRMNRAKRRGGAMGRAKKRVSKLRGKRLNSRVKVKARKIVVVNRRRNQEGGVAELREAFPGVPMEKSVELVGPDSAPDHTVPMGDLLEFVTTKEKIEFDEGDAALAVDARGKLHVLVPAIGNQLDFEAREDLGTLKSVTYGADKGDGSGYAPYEHHFGEEGGAKPHLETDADGMLVIRGGSYHMDEVFTNRAGRVARRVNRRRRNVEQGFYSGGVFHPIRASSDYSPSRAGEGGARKYKTARYKKAATGRKRAAAVRTAVRTRSKKPKGRVRRIS